MRKQKKEISHYSEEFKWQVVQKVLAGNLTKESARVVLHPSRLCAWMGGWCRWLGGRLLCV